MTDRPPIPSVNYHLWKPCNMGCNFCFAKFSDLTNELLPKGTLPRDESLKDCRTPGGSRFRQDQLRGRRADSLPLAARPHPSRERPRHDHVNRH